MVYRHLHFRSCASNGVSLPPLIKGAPMSLNEWYLVAASYDANTGDATINVDGNVQSENIGFVAAGATTGPVVMGSRYYHSGDRYDTRYFQGKIACMRLWNSVRDLHSLRIDTPLCTIY